MCGRSSTCAARAPRRCGRSPRKPRRWCASTRAPISGEHGDGLVRSEWVAWQFGPRLTKAFEASQGPVRSREPAQSRQDRAAVEDGRPLAVPLQAGLQEHRLQAGARLVGVERRRTIRCTEALTAPGTRRRHDRRLRQGRRDVQQQRALPQVRRRHDVPVLPRHPRREASDARPRQHAAARAVRPARTDALTSDAVAAAMDLCVSCKGCKRDCPTGVDMARMKIEVRSARRMSQGPAAGATG